MSTRGGDGLPLTGSDTVLDWIRHFNKPAVPSVKTDIIFLNKHNIVPSWVGYCLILQRLRMKFIVICQSVN